ncbi:hypothetical protein niasHT_000088 [Heterodera trifolii]|uniref:Fido domain-containing protein n=1 Tax=Heterodera trifolii TaxID=157864 RepID=A0ABD2LVP2_9BILA
MVLRMHKKIMYATNPLTAGDIRKTEIEVRDHSPVSAEEVPAKMAEFVAWFNSHEHTTNFLSLTAEVHYRLEKLLFAARAIAAIENPSDVVVVVSAIATPKPIQQHQPMPTQLDHQTVRGASNVNTPVIAMANTDSPFEFVDIVIPANNKVILPPSGAPGNEPKKFQQILI